MTYDKKCHDLAAAFLSDFDIADQESRDRYADQLAQRIQAAVEDFLNDQGFPL